MRRRRGRQALVLLLVMVVVAGLAGAGYAWWRARDRVSTDDAYVEGTIAPVAARVPGQVVEVLVDDHQAVTAGQVLARIDARDYRARVEQARAATLIAERRWRAAVERVTLGQAMAQGQETQARAATMRAEAARQSASSVVEASRATAHARRAALASAVADRDGALAMSDRANQDLLRARELFARELVARQFVDHAEAEARAAAATLTAASERMTQAARDLEIAEADVRLREAGFEPQQLGLRTAEARVVEAHAQTIQAEALTQEVRVREAERDLAQAQLREAEADLSLALLNLEHTEVRAPIAGVVAKKAVELGQVVQVGQPLLAVVPLHDVWVVANFKETQLRRLRPGMRADVTVDGFPDRAWRGTVEAVSAGTGARFSLLPPENATGNWVKVVQRVPVKILLEPESARAAPLLRAGLSAHVTVRLR